MLIGPNGSGKTSILEAIAYSSVLKSIKNDSKNSIIKNDKDLSKIKTNIINNGRNSTIDITLSKLNRDTVFINDVKASKSSQLLEEFTFTLFTPEDLNLIKGGPNLRRDYLDEILSNLSTYNLNSIRQFEKSLRQRNILLKQITLKNYMNYIDTLNVWDEQIVKYSTILVNLRKNLISELTPYIQKEFMRITNIKRDINISYISSVKDDIVLELADKRTEDIVRKTTTIGAHRDDIEITLGSLDSRRQLSQGQQRSLAISLKLAMHHILIDKKNKIPVILLDDVFSELDEEVSNNLLEQIYDYQAIVTSATKPLKKISIEKEVRMLNGECE